MGYGMKCDFLVSLVFRALIRLEVRDRDISEQDWHGDHPYQTSFRPTQKACLGLGLRQNGRGGLMARAGSIIHKLPTQYGEK